MTLRCFAARHKKKRQTDFIDHNKPPKKEVGRKKGRRTRACWHHTTWVINHLSPPLTFPTHYNIMTTIIILFHKVLSHNNHNNTI
jgi:hypothetical protein